MGYLAVYCIFSGSCYLCGVCSELCCLFFECLFLALCDFIMKNLIFDDGVVVV
jgi:hypothetical protein